MSIAPLGASASRSQPPQPILTRFAGMLLAAAAITGALLSSPPASADTLAVPQVDISSTEGLTVPLMLQTSARVASLRCRLVLDARYGVWATKPYPAAVTPKAAGYTLTAAPDKTDPRSLLLALEAPKPEPGKAGLPPLTGFAMLLAAYGKAADTPKPGRYTLQLLDVVAADAQGAPVELTPVSPGFVVKREYIDYGNVNDDYDVDIKDVVLMLKAIIGQEELSEDAKKAADVAPPHGDGTVGDGRVNVQDVLSVLKKVAGLAPRPWPEGLPFGSATIGAEGGTVSLPDGSATLQVPPGALAQPADIQIRGAGVQAPLGVLALELLPSGLRFQKPATLTFKVDPQLHPDPAQALRMSTTGLDGQPEPLKIDAQPGSGWASTQVEHFTVFRVDDYFAIYPRYSQVLEGSDRAFTVYWASATGPTTNVTKKAALEMWATPAGSFMGSLFTAPSAAPSQEVVIHARYHYTLPGSTVIGVVEGQALVNVVPRHWQGEDHSGGGADVGIYSNDYTTDYKLNFVLGDGFRVQGTVDETGHTFRMSGDGWISDIKPTGDGVATSGTLTGYYMPGEGLDGQFEFRYEGVTVRFPDYLQITYNPITHEVIDQTTQTSKSTTVYGPITPPATTGRGRSMQTQWMGFMSMMFGSYATSYGNLHAGQ
ncbi:MAG TPA: hypothetical protein VGN26_03715 [Armatimonadota bacterium]